MVDEVKANGFEMLGISSFSAEAAPNLPPHHRDRSTACSLRNANAIL
ncbi:MAG: hypothetical protein KBF84_04600 [Candidatus Microthrix sp.]|nr:hypothetical protein [Candidatus Microthrix sp.]MBP7594667.1 hypothetical protein [Candidatus Microthrix sp.]MBP9065343.1 hypothetical protein [Candidatus Microthrix sp.]